MYATNIIDFNHKSLINKHEHICTTYIKMKMINVSYLGIWQYIQFVGLIIEMESLCWICTALRCAWLRTFRKLLPQKDSLP